MRIACFISSHGFGHATRTFALLEELSKKNKITLCIYSSLPKWFIKENLRNIFYESYFAKTDIGLVQKGPFSHDLTDTLAQLNTFLKFQGTELKSVYKTIDQFEPDFFLCDISPLGLQIGKSLGIPTCLLENFTWDWIYKSYLKKEKEFSKPIEKLTTLKSSANLHLQTSPICQLVKSAKQINPIFRKPNKTALSIKKELRIESEIPIFLVTTGGITQEYSFLEKIKNAKQNIFLLTGDFQKIQRIGNMILLPQESKFYFPDLIHISDGIIGKVGYGTLAEAWGARKPLMGIFRKDFRESAVIRKFAKRNLDGFEISNHIFQNGRWIDKVDQLLKDCSKESRNEIKNGSKQAVEMIHIWAKNGFQ